MPNILLIGGTGNISGGIIKALRAHHGSAAKISVFNRGQHDDWLDADVIRLRGDRNNFPDFEKQFHNTTWDAVIDMICFRPDQAESAIRAFAGKTPQFIFCSTVCVYGNCQTTTPTSEGYVCDPLSTYGKNKLLCEEIFLKAARAGAFGKNGGVTIFRPSHTFGPGFNFHGQTGGGSPAYVDRLRRGLPVIVSGDGHGLWQITSSDNVGMGFAHAIGKQHTLNEVYNVVADKTRTWDQVTQESAAALGAPSPKIVHIPSDLLVSIDPVRYGGMHEIFRYHGVYTSAKLKRDIPEFREVTPFDEAVRATVKWMESRGPLKRAEEDPFETRLIEMYEAFCHSARESLAPKAH